MKSEHILSQRQRHPQLNRSCIFNRPFECVVECYFNGVTHSGFERTDLMNNRPRKCLGWKTPFEVFAKMTGKGYFINGSVALMG